MVALAATEQVWNQEVAVSVAVPKAAVGVAVADVAWTSGCNKDNSESFEIVDTCSHCTASICSTNLGTGYPINTNVPHTH